MTSFPSIQHRTQALKGPIKMDDCDQDAQHVYDQMGLFGFLPVHNGLKIALCVCVCWHMCANRIHQNQRYDFVLCTSMGCMFLRNYVLVSISFPFFSQRQRRTMHAKASPYSLFFKSLKERCCCPLHGGIFPIHVFSYNSKAITMKEEELKSIGI